MYKRFLPLAVLLVVGVVPPVVAENWAQFRGPSANGVSVEEGLPSEWNEDNNIAWKVAIPGVAWSQPIAWDGKIFVTTAVTDDQEKPSGGQSGPGFSLFSRQGISRAFFGGGEPPDATYRWKVLCLDGATGEVLWEQLAREGRPTIPIHRSNTYASETPVTDGERLIAYFGMTGLYCLDLSGNLLWTKELGAHPMQYGWGTGSSPAILGDRVFVQCDNEKTSFLVALNIETGDELWRVARDERSNWSTPYLWNNKLRNELVTAGGNKTRSYDPNSGELLWEMDASGRCSTTPVADEQLLYVGSVTRNTGSSGVLAAVRAGATGDISLTGSESANSFVAWSIPRAAPPIASPLLYQGCLYILEQRGGVIKCLDALTGQQHYRQRLPRAVGFSASPWASDGKVFCLDEDGQTVVIKAGPELQIIATNRLDDMFWSSAAVVGERLLLRGVDHLYCIGK
jgi:outer membrane protein assembly factor BamB